MEDLELLVGSSEFAVVKAAVEALDPMLLVDPKVGAHLLAFRTGLTRLAEIDFTPPAQPEDVPPIEPEPEAPGEAAGPDGEPEDDGETEPEGEGDSQPEANPEPEGEQP